MTEWDDLPTTGAPRPLPRTIGPVGGAAIFCVASVIATFAAAWAATAWAWEQLMQSINQQEPKP